LTLSSRPRTFHPSGPWASGSGGVRPSHELRGSLVPDLAVRRIRRGVVVSVLPLSPFWTGCGGDDIVEADPTPSIPSLATGRPQSSPSPVSYTPHSVVAGLSEAGATFDLNVQPSGQYTAILILNTQSQTEVGQMEVSGNEITLRPTIPPSAEAKMGTFSTNANGFEGDGVTQFDANEDGTPESAQAHFRFVSDAP